MANASAPDLYEVLGVARDATPADMKRAYRKLAAEFHPDRNPGDDEAAAKMSALNQAYAVLSDPVLRANYDEFGESVNPVEKAAHEMIMDLMSSVIDSDCRDPLSAAFENITGLQQRLSKNRIAANEDIARLTHRRKLFRRKNGPSLFDAIFDQKIQRAQDALLSMEHQEKVTLAMQKILLDYESLVPRTSQDPYSSSFRQRAGSGLDFLLGKD